MGGRWGPAGRDAQNPLLRSLIYSNQLIGDDG
jgi:hypothetical protein